MKPAVYILLLTVASCYRLPKQADSKSPTDNSPADTSCHSPTTKTIDNTRYHTNKDIVIITPETGDTSTYSKEEFNDIVDTHPEFFRDTPSDPDLAYYHGTIKGRFANEVGQDEYYTLYAYFLKQKNGIAKYAERRKTLTDIYENINSLYGLIQHGGTYFGHQTSRIAGYAEFSVYIYKQHENKISKNYDIAQEKGLYIKTLRQITDDENKTDKKTLAPEQLERKKEIHKIIDNIDKDITDIFYLRRAQMFQNDYYQYYE